MANRLSLETSPYLLQHAHNPVHWYPWCEEALTLAREADKPIFLSIGYSACHWCHVMERESFEDPAIAEYLNEHFVSIKVDREERPDLDQIYMQAVMALRGGQGGWPLSVFLTPSQHVFFGGTYWPPEPRYGMPSFRQILARVVDVFRHQRAEVEAQSLEVTRWLRQTSAAPTPATHLPPDRTQLARVATMLESNYDFVHGGFGGAPKFPHAMHLEFLLRWSRFGEDAGADTRLLNLVAHNLERMAQGGIYDHLGGGFARYSVDEQWLVPHFEKMLYDNALLAKTYLLAGAFLSQPYFLDVARETLDYLVRDMRHPDGGFYSAEDADSEGIEGKFYVWDRAEIVSALGDDAAHVFCEYFGVTRSGNFEGRNILHVTEPMARVAARLHRPLDEVQQSIAASRATLLALRNRRVRPQRDEKLLTNWNALAISAFAIGSLMLEAEHYAQIAKDAWRFIEHHAMDDDGRLRHSWKDRPGVPGFLDDYSFSVIALLDLYDATLDEYYLDRAVDLVEDMLRLFGGDDPGPLYYSGADAEPLIARSKDLHESSIPSGNAMAAWALVRLSRRIDRPEWLSAANHIVAAANRTIQQAPLAVGQMLIAALELLQPSREVVLVSPRAVDSGLVRQFQQLALVGCSIAYRSADQDAKRQSRHLDPMFAQRWEGIREPVLYVCRDRACEEPIVGAPAILRRLQAIRGTFQGERL